MKVALLISSLEAGGAERVMAIMANYWIKKEWTVSIITLSRQGSDFYELDPDINRIGLDELLESKNKLQSVFFNLRRSIKLRRTIRQIKPDIIISFVDIMNIMSILSTMGMKIPVIVSERVNPEQYIIGGVWEKLRFWTYPKSTCLVVQGDDIKDWAFSNWPQLNVKIIQNPVKIFNNNSEHINNPFPPGRWILAMGRLEKQKGFDLLLQSFSILKSKLSDSWKLVILGEGQQRSELEAMVKKQGIEDDVWLPGTVKNTTNYLDHASMFILSSRFEGFPNALLEAMASGLPVVSFDCPSGPAEIIENNENGILVPAGNVKSLADEMIRLAEDENECRKIGKNAYSVQKKYSVDKIMKQWETLIFEVCT